MKTATRFKKGDMVRVVNLDDKMFNRVAEIISLVESTDRYSLRFDNGYQCDRRHVDLVKDLNGEEQKELQKAQLLQMADLALELKDKEWFEQICKQIKSI